jgi:predicted PurR-regulated permease PerM
MNSDTLAKGLLKTLGTIVAITIVLYFLYLISTVLIYLIISMLLTLIASPVVVFLKRRLKFKNTLAVATTLGIFILILIGIIFLFIPLIASQSDNLSLLDTKAIESNMMELAHKFKLYLINHNIKIGNSLDFTNISSMINYNFITVFFNATIGTLGSFGMGLASVLFITFFFLKDKEMYLTAIKSIIPDEHESKILNSFDKINKMLSRYFIGLFIQLSVIFVMYLIVLLIFDVQNMLVIAFLCALLNIIPYVGPLIGSILAAILTMISNIGGDFQYEILPTTMYVLIGFWIVQIFDNNVSQPIIFSKSVNSNPLEIFLITLISGFLFGILGMIIAIPLYTVLKIIAKEFFPENEIVKIIAKNI